MSEVVNPLGGSFYMDNRLNKEMDKVVGAVVEKDKDRFFVVDGGEGVGKSVFTLQLAARVDPSFCLERVTFKPHTFREAILGASKGQAVVFDEAFTGLSSRASLSRINHLLVSLMMEMRQKNLFVFIVLPTIFLLDKYVALWRSVGLFHIYTHKGKRGFWMYFNKHKKKLLYLNGRQEYRYSGKGIPTSGFRGRFYDQYVVDEADYRAKKRKALGDDLAGDSPLLDVRNRLLKLIKDKLGLSYRDMESLLEEYEVYLKFSSISVAVKSVKD